MNISLKNLIIKGVTNFIVLLITLIVIETCLQVLTRIATRGQVLISLSKYTSLSNSDPKIRFIEGYEEERKIPMGQRVYEPHSDLGWVTQKSIKFTNKRGETYTTNSMGFRSLKDYTTLNREKYVVVILGDSFTFGSDADDSAVWPTLLQELDNDLEVVNLGVAGYATDQMYLMLKKYTAYFQPDLVIAAVYWDDVYRSLLSFRSFQKPKFELKNGELHLTNTPIGGIEEVYEKIKKEMGYKLVLSEIKLFNLAKNVIDLIKKHISENSAEYKELNEKIFQGMIETCQQHHADFLLLYIPAGRELIYSNYPSPVGEFLEEFAQKNSIYSLNPQSYFWESASFKLTKDSMRYLRNEGVSEKIVEALKPLKNQKYVNEREFLKLVEQHIDKEQAVKYQKQILESLDWQYNMGHYEKKEAAILSDAVHKKIKALPSYVEKVILDENLSKR